MPLGCDPSNLKLDISNRPDELQSLFLAVDLKRRWSEYVRRRGLSHRFLELGKLSLPCRVLPLRVTLHYLVL